ncbi:MAG: copper ABC transporter substrate-binding protein [Acidobacteria bacterium]|nr:MAG: copper ABC transporter substrate-binding protein [Acidobacteriota bacterium]
MKKTNKLTLYLLLLIHFPLKATSPLQLFIDLTPEGGTLKPIPGTYSGPIVIKKSIILDGQNEVVIDGNGTGSLLVIEADHVTVRRCKLIHSGHSHDKVDAGMTIKSDGNLVEENMIEEVLFGIHISQGNHNVVRNNRIRGWTDDKTLKGEGLRLWNGQNNTLEGNDIRDVRDCFFSNSIHNRIIGNRILNSRMGMEFIYSPDNEIAGNYFSNNDHGLVGIYSDNLWIHDNRIEHQRNLHGSALAIKGSSQVRLENNIIMDCAVGLTANSPTFPENILYIKNNQFLYNDVALYFYGDKGGHVIHGNRFTGNFQQVAVTGPTSARFNDWKGNYWQNYQGFDSDGDGYGDTPYSVYWYSERIWMERSMARFFRGTLTLGFIDFTERLIPYSKPVLIFEDPTPGVLRQ